MYIRTKDGVYELKENMTIENGVYSFFGKIYNTTEKHLFRNDKDLGEVVKQSETIEELCDCIIETKGHTGDYFHYTYTAFDESSKERLLDDMINQDFEVYYAIWTNKGLIYVAKMNENGDLRLL